MLLGSIPAFIFIANSIGNVAITRRTFFSCLYFIVALYLICEILSRCTKKIYPIIKAGSYASMAAYLFHRAVYFALTLLNGHKYLDVRVAYTAALPAVFIIGYFIQWSYDELINNFRKVKGIHGI